MEMRPPRNPPYHQHPITSTWSVMTMMITPWLHWWLRFRSGIKKCGYNYDNYGSIIRAMLTTTMIMPVGSEIREVW